MLVIPYVKEIQDGGWDEKMITAYHWILKTVVINS